MMVKKEFISAQQLLEDSFRLGIKIFESGFKPDYIVGIWRGGTPVGIAVQELLDYFGVKTDHIAIRTSSYEGIDRRNKEIRVHGLDYISDNVNFEDRLLIVDDVFDTGLSIDAVLNSLRTKARKNTPEKIKIATTYFKPENRKTGFIPDYYIHETSNWLIFPHELDGLSNSEIEEHKPNVSKLIQEVKKDGNNT